MIFILYNWYTFFEGKKVFGNNYENMINKWLLIASTNKNNSQNNMHKYGSKYIIDSDDLYYILTHLKPIINTYYNKKKIKIYC